MIPTCTPPPLTLLIIILILILVVCEFVNELHAELVERFVHLRSDLCLLPVAAPSNCPDRKADLKILTAKLG